jgi:hypothetical protein
VVESVSLLSSRGVPETKLLKKVRDARTPDALWPTWAELRAATILTEALDLDSIELEAARPAGRHADFRLHFPDGGGSVDMEFKAVGLSDDEQRWFAKAGRHLDALMPPRGLASLHAPIDAPIRVNADKLRRVWANSEHLAESTRALSPAWADVRGMAIIAHRSRETYVRRVVARLRAAIGQLPADGRECWLGLWWSNGAPLWAIGDAIVDMKLPDHVTAVLVLGQAVAVPWSQISVYMATIDPHAPAPQGLSVTSKVDDELATRVLERFESSSGLRCTSLRAPGVDGAELLRRAGRRRILPTALLFDADPRQFAGSLRNPSPVQDVRLID